MNVHYPVTASIPSAMLHDGMPAPIQRSRSGVVISLSPNHNWLKSIVDGSYNAGDGHRG